MTNTPYLPKYVLDQLSNRVAMKLDFFASIYKYDSVWGGEIQTLCQQIDNDPRYVNSVIVNEKITKKERISSDTYKYQACLTRIYILLYYRRHDDPLYSFVFDDLRKDMGRYANKNILEDMVEPEIKNIYKLNQMVEQNMKKNAASKDTSSEPKKSGLKFDDPIIQKRVDRIRQLYYLMDIPEDKRTEEQQAELKKLKEQVRQDFFGANMITTACNVVNTTAINPEDDIPDEEESTWHDKVRLDLLLRLIKSDGADLTKRGNKTRAAELMRDITGLPLQTCKNYCSNEDLNTNEHKEEVLKMNSKLQALDMNIRL